MFKTAEQLARTTKIGREELCQRLLTQLILDGPYPRWNTASIPAQRGLDFLRSLHRACFGDTWPGESDQLRFVDEFELKPRRDSERGGAPDYAVVWPHHIWMIELKTEAGSHRATQIPSYFELARHHHPACTIDLTYLTGEMDAPYRVIDPRSRYAHTTWAAVAPLIESTWADGPHPDLLAGLLGTIQNLSKQPSAWMAHLGRESLHQVPAPPTPAPAAATSASNPVASPYDQAVAEALGLAELTANDGRQRALDYQASGLDELHELRLSVRAALAASPAGSNLRHVGPWVWRPESKGRPLTEVGDEVGAELRVSRYRNPQY